LGSAGVRDDIPALDREKVQCSKGLRKTRCTAVEPNEPELRQETGTTR
jgi:hypothetical protein